MKQFLIFTCIITAFFINFPIDGFSQNFTRITSGAIVTDPDSSYGSSWGDYNNDGYEDLFVANYNSRERNAVNYLYKNNGNGTFTTINALPSSIGDSYNGTWGDYNNDGLLDLFIGRWAYTNNYLFQNSGNENFTNVTPQVIASLKEPTSSCSWIDVDNDGDLDLFAVNDSPDSRNKLYINDGNNNFSPVYSGTIVDDGNRSQHASWGDYDNDGDQDLFIAKYDWGAQISNQLFRNERNGNFTQILTGDIVSSGGKSFTSSWADYNNDGYLDLFVANISEHNFLYRNNRNGTFTKITDGIIANDVPAISLGASWSDLDNDGDLDLYVVNNRDQPNYLYLNNGNETFTKVTNNILVTSEGSSISSSWCDYDKNGFPDLYVTNEGPNFLFKNLGNTNNWINIKLRGTVSNTSGIGAKIWVYSGGRTQVREVSGLSGWASQNSLNGMFGLGTHSLIDSITIKWPSLGVQKLYNVMPNQFLTITESVSPEVNAGKDQIICRNSAVSLNGELTGGKYNVIWSGGKGTFNPGADFLNTVYTPTQEEIASGNIILKLTTTCNSNCDSISDEVRITFRPAPKVYAGSDKTICANLKRVSLSGKISNAVSALWRSSGTGLFSPDSTSLKVSYKFSEKDILNGTVKITLLSADTGACAAMDEMILTILPSPIINAGNDVSICKGTSVTLSASGAVKYEWTPATGLDNANAVSPVASPDTTIQYKVLGTASNGCTGSDKVIVDVIISDPVLIGPSTVCNGNTYSYKLKYVPTGSVVNWVVSGGTIIEGNDTPLIKVLIDNYTSKSGYVRAHYTTCSNHKGNLLKKLSKKNCTSKAYDNEEDGAEVDESLVLFYPNPFTNYTTIRTQSQEDTPVTIEIIDISGKIIETIHGIEDGQEYIMGSSFQPGIYFVKVISAENAATYRVVKN